MKIIVKRQYTGPSAPELGTPTAITFGSATIPLARPSSGPRGVATYTIQRATTIAGPYTTLATGPLIFGNQPTAYVDGALAATTTYFWRANAADADGFTSEWSAPVTGTTTTAVDSVPPTVPTGLSGTALSTSLIRWSWNASTDTGGSGLAGYTLETSANGTSGWSTVATSGTAQSADESGLSASQTRVARIRAFDGAGNFSLNSPNSSATTNAPTGGTDPYPLYTSFDRNDIPWHAGSGLWGAQVTLQAANPPVTTATVDVTTSGGYTTAVTTGARIVRVMANIGDVTLQPANDTDIVIMPGVRCGELRFTGAFSRLRVRGPTIGTYSGGSIAKFAGNAPGGIEQNDIILDGIGISGSGGGNGFVIEPHYGVNRMAILNCRIRAGVAMSYMSYVRHLFVANTSGIAGASGAGVTWGFRHDDDGPIVFVDCDFRTPFAPGVGAYHRIRSKPTTGSSSGKHFYVDDSVFVDSGQSTFLWANLTSASTASDRHSSMIVRRVRTYSGGAGGNGTIYPEAVANYAEVTNGQFFGRPSVGDLASSESGSLASVKNFSGNTFNTYTGDPAWTAAGDPSSLPLV